MKLSQQYFSASQQTYNIQQFKEAIIQQDVFNDQWCLKQVYENQLLKLQTEIIQSNCMYDVDVVQDILCIIPQEDKNLSYYLFNLLQTNKYLAISYLVQQGYQKRLEFSQQQYFQYQQFKVDIYNLKLQEIKNHSNLNDLIRNLTKEVQKYQRIYFKQQSRECLYVNYQFLIEIIQNLDSKEQLLELFEIGKELLIVYLYNINNQFFNQYQEWLKLQQQLLNQNINLRHFENQILHMEPVWLYGCFPCLAQILQDSDQQISEEQENQLSNQQLKYVQLLKDLQHIEKNDVYAKIITYFIQKQSDNNILNNNQRYIQFVQEVNDNISNKDHQKQELQKLDYFDLELLFRYLNEKKEDVTLFSYFHKMQNNILITQTKNQFIDYIVETNQFKQIKHDIKLILIKQFKYSVLNAQINPFLLHNKHVQKYIKQLETDTRKQNIDYQNIYYQIQLLKDQQHQQFAQNLFKESQILCYHFLDKQIHGFDSYYQNFLNIIKQEQLSKYNEEQEILRYKQEIQQKFNNLLLNQQLTSDDLCNSIYQEIIDQISQDIDTNYQTYNNQDVLELVTYFHCKPYAQYQIFLKQHLFLYVKFLIEKESNFKKLFTETEQNKTLKRLQMMMQMKQKILQYLQSLQPYQKAETDKYIQSEIGECIDDKFVDQIINQQESDVQEVLKELDQQPIIKIYYLQQIMGKEQYIESYNYQSQSEDNPLLKMKIDSEKLIILEQMCGQKIHNMLDLNLWFKNQSQNIEAAQQLLQYISDCNFNTINPEQIVIQKLISERKSLKYWSGQIINQKLLTIESQQNKISWDGYWQQKEEDAQFKADSVTNKIINIMLIKVYFQNFKQLEPFIMDKKKIPSLYNFVKSLLKKK